MKILLSCVVFALFIGWVNLSALIAGENKVAETNRVVLHCTPGGDSDDDGWEVFVLSSKVFEMVGQKVQPVQIQLVNRSGNIRFVGGALGMLYPDSKHTFHLVSPGRKGNVTLSAGIVKLDPGRPHFGAQLEADTWDSIGHLKIQSTQLSCRLFTE